MNILIKFKVIHIDKLKPAARTVTTMTTQYRVP